MKVLLTTTASLLVAALAGCSQATPDSNSVAVTPASQVVVRTTGFRVDSINGIPGHRFGDPLSTFPGLTVLTGESGATKRYYYPSSRPAPGTAWFAGHNSEFDVTYFFIDNKFATIVVTSYGDHRKLLHDETVYLFGPGDHYETDGTIWRGREAYATYVNTFTPHGPAARLEIGSESLAAMQKKNEAAKLRADNEMK